MKAKVLSYLLLSIASSCYTSAQASERIIDGEKVLKGEYPFFVELNSGSTLDSHVCGGALLKGRWVITAAHCVSDLPESIELKAYIERLDFTDQNSYLDKVNITEIYINPKFFTPPYDGAPDGARNPNGDIALLKLAHQVNLTDEVYINGINADIKIPDGASVVTMGFGGSDGTHADSNELEKGKTKIVSYQNCVEPYPGLPSYIDPHFGGCAVRNTTAGDSGGPWVMKDNNDRNVVVGVTSRGLIDFAQFTKIDSFSSWINDIISNN